MTKDPGPGGMRLRQVPLDMSFAEAFSVRNPDAYERLVMDVVRGNQTLFMRRDEVEAAWTWIDPILRRLGRQRPSRRSPTPPAPGGRRAAIALIERDGRTWLEETVDASAPRLSRRAGARQGPARRGRGTISSRASPARRRLLAVSGGTTPVAVLRRFWRGARLDWARVTVTLVDERWVPESSTAPMRGWCSEHLLRRRGGGDASCRSAGRRSPRPPRRGGARCRAAAARRRGPRHGQGRPHRLVLSGRRQSGGGAHRRGARRVDDTRAARRAASRA